MQVQMNKKHCSSESCEHYEMMELGILPIFLVHLYDWTGDNASTYLSTFNNMWQNVTYYMVECI